MLDCDNNESYYWPVAEALMEVNLRADKFVIDDFNSYDVFSLLKRVSGHCFDCLSSGLFSLNIKCKQINTQ